MLLSTLAGLNRKDGKLVILAQAAHILSGGDVSKVTRAYQTLLGNTDVGAKQRAQFSHVLFVVDNQVRASHEFPDLPALAENAARALEITAASEALQAAKVKMQASRADAEALRAEIEQANAQARAAGLEEIALPVYLEDQRAELDRLQAELEKLRNQPPQQPEQEPPFELDHTSQGSEGDEPPVGSSPLVPN